MTTKISTPSSNLLHFYQSLHTYLETIKKIAITYTMEVFAVLTQVQMLQLFMDDNARNPSTVHVAFGT